LSSRGWVRGKTRGSMVLALLSYEEEDTCVSYEEEDTCVSYDTRQGGSMVLALLCSKKKGMNYAVFYFSKKKFICMKSLHGIF
jgi:hypothetical protein